MPDDEEDEKPSLTDFLVRTMEEFGRNPESEPDVFLCIWVTKDKDIVVSRFCPAILAIGVLTSAIEVIKANIAIEQKSSE